MPDIQYNSDNLRLEIDRDVPIARFYIARPEKLNAITLAMRREIVHFFDLIEQDERIRVVVLRGAPQGKGFSAGGDIPGFLGVPVAQLANLAYSMSSPERCTKPVIAAIDGHCYGGGLELALSCDFRIATPNSQFAFPEIRSGRCPAAAARNARYDSWALAAPAQWCRPAGRSTLNRPNAGASSPGSILRSDSMKKLTRSPSTCAGFHQSL